MTTRSNAAHRPPERAQTVHGPSWRASLLNLLVALIVTVAAVEAGGRLLLGGLRSLRRAQIATGIAGSELESKYNHDFADPKTKIRYDYDMFLGWRARPNQRGETYALNNLGRRDSVDYGPLTGPAVFLTGGSAAWSVGASDNANTLSAALERHLNTDRSVAQPVKVYNFAEQAYGLRQETLAIVDAFRLGRPETVVFYDGVNDSHTVFMGRDPERLRTYGDFGEILKRALEEYTDDRFVSMRTVLDGSVFWTVGRKSLGLLGRRPPVRTLTPEEAERIHDFFRGELRQLHQLLAGQGIRAVFVLQPIGYVSKPPAENERFLVEDGAGDMQWWRQAYEVLERAYAEARDQDGVETLSLRDVFHDEPRTVFIDPVHMNDLGNDLVARALAARLDGSR